MYLIGQRLTGSAEVRTILKVVRRYQMRQFSVVVIALMVIMLSSTAQAGIFGGCLSKIRARNACASQASCVQSASVCETSCAQSRPVYNVASKAVTATGRVVSGAATVVHNTVQGTATVARGAAAVPVRVLQNVGCANGKCYRQ